MQYFKCPFCSRRYVDKGALYVHMEDKHHDELCGLPAAQIYFNYKNRYALTKGNGRSIVSGKPTKFNLDTERYEKFVDDNERKQYREMFKARMLQKYGRETLLNDPKHQEKMLANRSISGEYIWPNGSKTTYTGSYEKAFLEHLDLYFNWSNPEDVVAPSTHIFTYVYEGKTHFHIPDFEIESLNLIINIKSSENKGYRLRDIESERLEDIAIKRSSFNYIKIYDNDFRAFDKLFEVLKNSDDDTKRYFVCKIK